MDSSIPQLKCKNCGAPIPYVAGENVLHCSYCGSTNMIAALDNIVKVEEHFIIPNNLNSASAQQHCRKWMGEGFFKAADLPQKAGFSQIQAVYLPFWVVNVQADTHWSGMSRHTRTVGYGNSRRIEVYYEPENGSFSDKIGWVVYARASLNEFYGLAALNPGASATTADWGGFALDLGLGSRKSQGIDLTTGKKPFTADTAKDIKILNGQITQDQANDRSRAQILNYHRDKAASKVDKLMDCDTNIQIGRTELIYAPLWFVEYMYKGKKYHILLEGHQGRIITGEAPVGKWDKVVVTAGVGGAVAIACAAGAYYYNFPGLFVGSAVAVIAVGVYAIITAFRD